MKNGKKKKKKAQSHLNWPWMWGNPTRLFLYYCCRRGSAVPKEALRCRNEALWLSFLTVAEVHWHCSQAGVARSKPGERFTRAQSTPRHLSEWRDFCLFFSTKIFTLSQRRAETLVKGRGFPPPRKAAWPLNAAFTRYTVSSPKAGGGLRPTPESTVATSRWKIPLKNNLFDAVPARSVGTVKVPHRSWNDGDHDSSDCRRLRDTRASKCCVGAGCCCWWWWRRRRESASRSCQLWIINTPTVYTCREPALLILFGERKSQRARRGEASQCSPSITSWTNASSRLTAEQRDL